jgi:hypothetical protein
MAARPPDEFPNAQANLGSAAISRLTFGHLKPEVMISAVIRG